MGDHFHIGFRLEEFTVRPVKNQVEGPSGASHVSPRAMELLLALARKPGYVLSRNRLKEAVWGREPVSPAVITRSVGELRHVLGDDASSPRFIQTIPGRGYRLIPDPIPLDTPEVTPGIPQETAPGEHESGNLFGFITDLARRKVYRIAASYLVVAWVVLQVADVLLDAFPLPAYSMTFVVVALAMGFPVAVMLAWAFQWTPQGLMVEGPGGRMRSFASGAAPGKLVIGIAVVSAALVGTGAYLLTATEPEPGEPSNESIAVLPFVNFSDDKENEYFSDGLTEEVLNVLAQLGHLQVASRTSSFYYKGKDQDIKKIAEALNVRYVMEGSVRLAGENMRITAQLIDGTNGYHMWSGTYDREVSDVFAVQGDIARQVARNLKIVIDSAVENVLEKIPTENFEAYDAYLRGIDYLRRINTQENMTNALLQFQQATTLDSGFGLAYAGLCETRLRQYQDNPEARLYELAEKACFRAMTRDGNSAEVSLALGRLHLKSGQLELAMEEIDGAKTLKPRWVEVWLVRAEALTAVGLTDEAEQELKSAIELDPGYWFSYQSLGNLYFRGARYSDAIANYEEVLKRSPDNVSTFNNIGAAYMLSGDFQSAAEVWLQATELDGGKNDSDLYGNIGSMYFYLRRFDDAVSMYRTAIDLAPDRFLFWGTLGETYRQIPDAWNKANDAYQKAFELGESSLKINPEDFGVMSDIAPFYAAVGEFEKAYELLEKSRASNTDNYYYFYNSALVYVRAGNVVKAEDSLMRAVELGYPVSLLYRDAGFDSLQGRPRFEALVDSGGAGAVSGRK